MTNSFTKIDATDPQHQISAFEEAIARAEKNIIIFSDEVQKQTRLKIELEVQLAELKKQFA